METNDLVRSPGFEPGRSLYGALSTELGAVGAPHPGSRKVRGYYFIVTLVEVAARRIVISVFTLTLCAVRTHHLGGLVPDLVQRLPG